MEYCSTLLQEFPSKDLDSLFIGETIYTVSKKERK